MNKRVLIILLIFFSISIVKVEHPGVNNDQLMFVNAATFRPDNQFLWKSFKGFPIMIFPYIGALKAYIYMPVFYFLDVNIYTIRIPQIILMGIALFVLYKASVLAFNQRIALLSILFLSLDPSLIAHTRIDVGPIVLETLFIAIAIYFLYLYLAKKKIVYILIAFPVLALGLFNKLNFIWFINAFFASFVIVYGKKFYDDLKNKGSLYPIVLLLVPYLILLRFALKLSKEVTANYKVFSNEISVINIFSNSPITFNHLMSLINGEQLFKMIYGYDPTGLGNLFALLFFSILLGGLGYLLAKRRNLKGSTYFFVLLTVLTLIQVLLTRRATNPWHVFPIFLFLTMLFAVVINEFKLKKIYLWGLVVIVIAYKLSVNYQYLNNYSKPTRLTSYSSSIYSLVEFAKIRPEHFMCLDVDICNQLLSLTQISYKFYEPFPFLNPDSYEKSLDEQGEKINSRGVLFVSHGNSTSHFPDFKKSFFNYVTKNKKELVKINEFKEEENVIFEIYSLN